MANDDRSRSRGDLERLRAGAAFDNPRLCDLVSAATAPGRPGELTGMDEAIAAFHAPPAGDETLEPPRRGGRVVLKTFASGAVATKIMAGAVGAAAVGGVALAAGAGHLAESASAHRPSIPRTARAASDHQLDLVRSTAARMSSTSVATPTRTPTSPARAQPTKTRAATKPSPSLLGLCHAWQAHAKQVDSRGRWANSRAFTVLVTAADGVHSVDRYCTAVIAAAPHGRPNVGPIHGPRKVRPIPVPTTPGTERGAPIALATDSPMQGPSVPVHHSPL